MCQPDLTLRSVYWRDDGQSVAANNTISHECVNWDALQDWVGAHTIDPKARVVQRPDGTFACGGVLHYQPVLTVVGGFFEGVHPPPPRCSTKRRDQ
jgi:hypothetical protein